MNRIGGKTNSGLTGSALRTWGMLFMLAGVVGRGIFQNHLLGLGDASNQQLLLTMLEEQNGMLYASLALILQALETCAAPIFAFLLVEGFKHTADFMKYLLRVAGVAVISEIPYNLAISGTALDMSSRNPVFGIVLGLIIMYFYNRYTEKLVKNFAIKLVVTLAAILWSSMLRIESGACIVILVAVLWAFRNKTTFRDIMGTSAAIACCLISPFYLVSPMGFMAIHFYNGEKGEQNKWVNYLAYPVILLAIGLVGIFLL